jgi:hypothetical protein
MKISHVFLSLVCLHLNLKEIYLNECDEWTRKHLFNSTEFHAYNSTFPFVIIDSINDLNINFSCKLNLKNDFQNGLKLYANEKVLIGNDLYLANFLSLFSANPIPMIFIQNVNGFNQNILNNNIHTFNFDDTQIEYDLINVNLDFYINDTLLSKDKCVRENFDRNMISFFGQIQTLALVDNAFYNNKICPHVFMNVRLKRLDLYQIANSLIFMNRLEFLDIGEFDLRTQTLEMYQMHVVHETITLGNLNKNIFKHCKYLIVMGIVETVEKTLFKNFQHIKLVQIKPENFVAFLHAGTQWINALNHDLNIQFEAEFRKNAHRVITLELVDTSGFLKDAYAYPDRDFCLFKNFPHSQLIAPVIILGKGGLECTCSLIWLHKYWKRYYQTREYIEYNNYVTFNMDIEKDLESKEICLLEEKNFRLLYDKCNFTQMSSKCLNSTSSVEKIYFQGNINLYFHLKWLQYIIEVFLRPILCLIGLIMNILTLEVIKNRKHSCHFKSPMYKHIQFNALFNIFFCFIYSFSLMNICIFPKSSFCSSVLKNESNQNMKIYLIYFLGNTFRLCCNFSYISFSSSRCISTITTSEKILGNF